MTRPEEDFLKAVTGGGVSSPGSELIARFLEETVIVDRVRRRSAWGWLDGPATAFCCVGGRCDLGLGGAEAGDFGRAEPRTEGVAG